ncbi:hypothetical protein FD13_GL000153 [Levilactobacillus senmaizukei DSM 21775 = NBRC 103853]|uniref:Uncharacterized protein n=1 Tax=Levilactobacillus senmaizukei DSM 21775 = NBRC 103853 TaxID=1423803 RepID=A0A0R2DH76_9LACO|nr:hypothetical protein [Levilactobacillus senmaizukei]KRN03369.1 hypothetical protein FD13_GL000153 [Levilactobacillus senmaizukei DSM 21775 = NBRC 103853]
MKTKLTLDLERTLYEYCRETGAAPVEEVTMPDDQGIVDTLSYQALPSGDIEWRCYELKVTKSDFHSQAKLSFVGHYNYFVLPLKLYKQVTDEIPAGIGVLIYRPFNPTMLATATEPPLTPGYLTVARSPRRQPLQVPATELTTRFIASQAREVYKAKQMATGLKQYHTDQLYHELKRRHQHYDIYDPDRNFYDQFIEDTESTAVTALQSEVDALNLEIYQLQHPEKK